MTVLDMNNKHNPCPTLLVTCPNNGCKKSLQQSVLLQHLKECEFQLVPCPIMGCNEKLQRRNLDDHLKSNVSQHQLAMSKQMFLLQEKHEEDLRKTKEELEDKSKQLSMLQERYKEDLQKAKEEFEDKLKSVQTMLLNELEKVQHKLIGLDDMQNTFAKSVEEMNKTEHFINGMTKIAAKLRIEDCIFIHEFIVSSSFMNLLYLLHLLYLHS